MAEGSAWVDPTYGSIDRDIQEHLAEWDASVPERHALGLTLQGRRNAGGVVLGVVQHSRVGLVKDLLSSDGHSRPGDENLTGLGDALSGLDSALQLVVAAALYERATERLRAADQAEQVALYLPPDEFRERALEAAEQAARLWREACHAQRQERPGTPEAVELEPPLEADCGNRFSDDSLITCDEHTDDMHNGGPMSWGDPPKRIRRWCWRCFGYRWFDRKAIDAEPGWLWIYLDQRCHVGGPS